ncbi:MAG: DUF2071 domain-containing protein [Chloroflexota bacterium]|nr:DUF2071 domain-containing protein [Chloroflexota bacterium]MDE2961633.1 DUF2071 domain-containing protein [Chloroflexota bacterium]
MITARWRNVAILSWPTEDGLLVPFLPNGLALDRWRGTAYISLVCLFMENLRVLGLPALPRKFAELNLRCYVRPTHGSDDRKGVVFLRQLVSSRLVALAGRVFFREPMLATALFHKCEPADPGNGPDQQSVRYRWANAGHDGELRVTARGDTYFAEPGSLDEFLTHRYWGYNGKSGQGVRAYRISREPWSLVPVVDHELKCDAETLYGPQIADAMAGPPASALLALGSESRVHLPTKLR